MPEVEYSSDKVTCRLFRSVTVNDGRYCFILHYICKLDLNVTRGDAMCNCMCSVTFDQ